MVPVHYAHRPRSVIYTDDRESANVHVVEAGLAMVHLFGSDGRPEGAEIRGLKRPNMRRLFTKVVERREELLAE